MLKRPSLLPDLPQIPAAPFAGRAHGDDARDFFESFKPVDSPHDHRWVISDGPDPADKARGYEARCERCGLHVVAMVRAVGLSIGATLYVSGYRINGAIHVAAPSSREPYAPAKHGRCAPR